MTFDDRRNALHATNVAGCADHIPTAIVGRAALEAAAPGIPQRLEGQISPISPNMVRRIYEHIWQVAKKVFATTS